MSRKDKRDSNLWAEEGSTSAAATQHKYRKCNLRLFIAANQFQNFEKCDTLRNIQNIKFRRDQTNSTDENWLPIFKLVVSQPNLCNFTE